MAPLAKSLRRLVLLGVVLAVLCDGSEHNDRTTTDGRQLHPAGDDNTELAQPAPAAHDRGDDQPPADNTGAEIQNAGRKPDTVDTDLLDEQRPPNSNCTNAFNETSCVDEVAPGVTGYFRKMVSDNKDMLLRTFYVVISITGIIVVYFIIKMIRTRQRQSRTKRYGLLTSRDDHLEMTPLDVDDDEDDMTLFDVNQTK